MTQPHPENHVVRAGRLRLGVALVLLWWLPLWALGPWIANSLRDIANPPSAAAVTTAIIVVQTIIGLLGFWIAGTQVKSIIRHSTKRQALRAAWTVLRHGRLPAAPDRDGESPKHPGSWPET